MANGFVCIWTMHARVGDEHLLLLWLSILRHFLGFEVPITIQNCGWFRGLKPGRIPR